MSITTSISSLSRDIRKEILTDLQIVSEKKSPTQAFVITEDKQLHLPYSYAFSKLKLKPPSRSVYDYTESELTISLRDNQKQIQNEVLQFLKKSGTCVCSLHVGWGKSVLAISLATKLKFKTLIVVNRLVLAKQWSDLITKITNSSSQIVTTSSKIADHDFYIINIQNISKIDRDFIASIGFVICDEIHLLISPRNIKQLLHLTPRYLIGLSATPFRTDELDCLINTFFGCNQITEELKRNHKVYPIHTNLKIPFEIDWRGKMDWNSLLTNQASNVERNDLIIDIVKYFSDRYFLILVKRVEQGRYLYAKLQEEKENVCNLLGSKSVLDDNSRIIIATTQKCGVGFSCEKLDSLLLASDMENYFIQYLGRVFRRPEVEPIIFDLIDNNPVLKKHFNSRKKVYTDVGGKIEHVVNIDDLIKKN